MKTKIIIYSALITSIVFTASSCKKFLDEQPISSSTTTNSYTTASDAEAAITGVYDSFSQDYYIWDNILYSDVRSDNYYAGGDNSEIYQMDYLTLSSTNSKVYSDWSSLYNAIMKANTVLEKIPDINDGKLTATRKNQILGEALFLRAYHYYQLVTHWGGVPLITSTIKSTSTSDTQLPRNSEAEVYQQIIADLNTALGYLPDTYGTDASINKARATKGAVNALLAKVYAQKSDRDYTKVLNYCNAVINSSAGYALIDFSNLWDGAHYNNNESIMEIQFSGTDTNWGPQMLLPYSLSGDTWRKFVTPSKNLVAAFDEAGDTKRKNTSILYETAQWSDEYWSLTVGANPIPFAYKWKSASGWASLNRQYIFRLGDIILLKAEALNELGRTGEAITELNKIRTRANLLGTTSTSQTDLRTAILKERRLELCQEGQRWDDLVRAGTVINTMNNLSEIDLRTNTKTNYVMNTNKILLPIPSTEMNRNPSLTQNPGY